VPSFAERTFLVFHVLDGQLPSDHGILDGEQKEMKTLFLEIEMERDWAVASIGPAYLSSYVEAHGHRSEIYHVKIDTPLSEVIEEVRRHAPQLLALSLTTRQWLRAREVVAAIRKELFIPTIAGGLHPTFAAEETLAKQGFDYVCLGEGEEAFLEFLDRMESSGSVGDGELDNIWVQGGKRPKLRPPVAKLDELPFMDRAFLNERYGVANMVTQRGCPFPCTYCAARMYNEMYGTEQYGRRRSISNVMQELHHLRESEGLSYVIFLDDTFTINHKWIRRFLETYKDEIAVPFSIHARAETINQDLLARLADAGCKHITFGVESGSERLRYDVMHRKVTNKRLIEAFQWSHSLGIITTANYIIGTPTETRDDIEQTIALHHKLKPHDFGYFVFYPYPGTPMYKTCKDMGILPENFEDLPANHRQTILLHDKLTDADIEEYYQRFTQLREENYLARYGMNLSQQGKTDLREQVEQSADQG
jgi:anaerobic magnesium-protoporphyrin IX monomethyl ester cyclase